MTVTFPVTDDAIARALREGRTLPREVSLEVDFAEIPERARYLLTEYFALSKDGAQLSFPSKHYHRHVKVYDPSQSYGRPERKVEAVDGGTLDDVLALLEEADRSGPLVDGALAERERAERERDRARLEAFADGDTKYYGKRDDPRSFERTFEEAGVAEGDPLRARVLARVEAYREARRAADAAAAEERRAADAARREREAAVAEAQASWAREHGSARLRKALEGGYEATRLYVEERAALELPGFEVDFDGTAEWKDRVGPSEPALDLAESVDGTVVWLTRPVGDDEDGDSWYEFDETEAVVVEFLDGDPSVRTGYWAVREVDGAPAEPAP